MITKQQVEALSREYQIDQFTIIREYLQLLFLSYLYREKQGSKIFFKGGIAIRFLFESPRFSEDLDFSTVFDKGEVKRIMKDLERAMRRELSELKIIPLYFGRKTSRFRLKYQPSDFKYPLAIRLDFNSQKIFRKIVVSPIISKFPIAIFPLVCHLSAEELLAEKISALATRNKGRDFFDVWFLLEKGVRIDESLVARKLKEAGEKFDKSTLIKKIKTHSSAKLNQDLVRFLPQSQRKIVPILKERLLKELISINGPKA